MILFPLAALGGQLLTVALAQVSSQLPELNYAAICRDSASVELGLKDDRAICMQDEAQARAQLAEKWSGFSVSGRSTCLRLSSQNHVGSYVEMLTCLEMDRDARELTKGADLGIGAAEPARAVDPAREVDPARTGAVQRRAPPVALAAPAPAAGPSPGPATSGISTPNLLWIFCPPGISDRLPNCPHPDAMPR